MLERMSPICKPVHIFFVRRLLSFLALGDFMGPVIDAAGTRHFEPDGVVFSRPSLPCPVQPTGDGEPPSVAGCAS